MDGNVSTSIPEAIDVILQIPDEECSNVEFPQETLNENFEDESLAELYYKKADNYYNGTNGYFQDMDRAAEYFERSGNLGKVEAFRKAGYIWEKFKDNNGKALEFYHQGAQKGDMLCYAYLGEIYLNNNENRYYNRRNADIAWSSFFEYVDELSTLEDFSWIWDFENIGYNVKKIIFSSILHGEAILPQHEEFLYKHRKKIYNTIKDEMKQFSEEYPKLVDYYEKKLLPYIEGLEEKYLLSHGEGIELAKNYFIIAEKYFYGTTISSGLENYPQNYIKAMTLFAKSAELGYKRAYIYQGVCWLKKEQSKECK